MRELKEKIVFYKNIVFSDGSLQLDTLTQLVKRAKIYYIDI